MEIFGNGARTTGLLTSKQPSKILIRSYLKILIPIVYFGAVPGSALRWTVDLLLGTLVPRRSAATSSVCVSSVLHPERGLENVE